MRIRIHKSRSTASSLSIGILIASISVAGAFDIGQVRSKLVRLATNGSISLGEQDAAPSPKNTPTPPSSEQALSNTGNSRNDGPECDNNGNKDVNNDRGNGETVGNGGARDCTDDGVGTETVTVTADVDPEGSGSANASPAFVTKSSGKVTLHAKPNQNYSFVYWSCTSGSIKDKDKLNTTLSEITENTTCTAHMIDTTGAETVTVTAVVDPAGSGSANASPPIFRKNALNVTVGLSATPNPNYSFDYWSCTSGSLNNMNTKNAILSLSEITSNVVCNAHMKAPNNGTTKTKTAPSAGENNANTALSVTLSDMVTTYNGNRQSPTVTPSSSKANCTTTYNGSKAMPRNAGTYDVVAKCKLDNIAGNAAGQFIIKKASSPLTWDDPAPMTVNDVLSRMQLRATSTVVGSYEYSPSKGSKMPAGSHKLGVIFTPLHSENYLSSTASVNINVMTVANKMKPIVIPFALSSSKISASSRVAISKMILNSNLTKVTVLGYAQPSKSSKNDKSLSEKRAKAVALSIKSLFPNVKITVKAHGSKLNPSCKSQLNKCVVIQ